MYTAKHSLPSLRRIHFIIMALLVAATASFVVLGPLRASTSPGADKPSLAPPPARPDAPEPERFDPDLAKQIAQAVLSASFEDIEPEVRLAVLAFVRLAGDIDWEERLLARLDSEPDPEVRAFIAVTLGALGTAEAIEQIRALYHAEDVEADPVLQVFYDHALALLGDGQAAQRVVKAARAKDAVLAFSAGLIVAELGRSGDTKAIRILEDLARREAELRRHHPHAGLSILAALARLGHKPARQALRDHLGNQDQAVRLESARHLATLGDDAGRGALLDIYNSADSRLRVPAAAALVELGEYAGADLLMACVHDKRSSYRSTCARALSVIGVMDHVLELQKLYHEQDRVVAVAAATAVLFILGLQPSVLAREAIDWVAVAMRSDDWATRLDATRVMASLPDQVAVPLLAQAVVDEHKEVRKSATDALARRKTTDAARTVAAALRSEADAEVREHQVIALARIGDPVAAETLQELARHDDRLGTLATGAHIAVLDEVKDAALIDQALEKLARAYQRGRSTIRLAAMESAALADNTRAVPTLELGLLDRVAEIRLAAAQGLAHYRVAHERVLAALRGLTGDQGSDARPVDHAASALAFRATAALIELGQKEQPRLALAEMLEHPSTDIRLEAVPAVADVSWSDARSLLALALADRQPEVRHAAIDTLDPFAVEHPREAVHLLKSMLRDTEPAVRAKAKARLAELLPRDATPATELAGATVDPRPLQDALADMRALHEALQRQERALADIVRDIEARTQERARDDSEVDAIEDLGETLDRAHKSLVASYGRVGAALADVRREAGRFPANDPKARASLDQASAAYRESQSIVDTSGKGVELALAKVTQYVALERSVDKDLCIQAAETAIASGHLAAARRDLECAERVYRKRTDYNPRLYYAWGYYYDERAQKSENAKARQRSLRKAKEHYDQFIAKGQGYLVDRVKERLDEIAADLAELGGK